MTEQQLLKVLYKTLKEYYDENNLCFTEHYLYAMGEIPIALVAHLDTVHKQPPTDFFHDQEKGYLWTPEGLGADDRAGVFSILMLLRAGYRPSIIFLTQEEVGGLGASAFIKDWPAPAEETNFLIELDRKGEDDAVYYDCGNEEFERFISKFGFVTDWGTFSDISIIAPAWDRAAVNLSIGYFSEHTLCERLNYRYMFKTIERVKRILDSYIPDKIYKFEGIDWTKVTGFFHPRMLGNQTLCDCCETWVPNDALVPAYDEETGDKWRLCPDCTVKNVTWCKECGKAIIDPDHTHPVCEQCRTKRKVNNEKS